jgi:hypothetical protein
MREKEIPPNVLSLYTVPIRELEYDLGMAIKFWLRGLTSCDPDFDDIWVQALILATCIFYVWQGFTAGEHEEKQKKENGVSHYC